MSNSRLDMILAMMRSNPGDAFLRYAAALEYKKADDHVESIRILKQLVKDIPTYLPSYYMLGSILTEKGQTDKAILIFKEGKEIAKKQNDSKTLGELSEALMLLDIYDDEEA